MFLNESLCTLWIISSNNSMLNLIIKYWIKIHTTRFLLHRLVTFGCYFWNENWKYYYFLFDSLLKFVIQPCDWLNDWFYHIWNLKIPFHFFGLVIVIFINSVIMTPQNTNTIRLHLRWLIENNSEAKIFMYWFV